MSRFQACLLTTQAETQTAGQRSEEIARCVGPQKSGLMRALFQLDPVTKIDRMVDNPVNAEYSFLITFQSEAYLSRCFQYHSRAQPHVRCHGLQHYGIGLRVQNRPAHCQVIAGATSSRGKNHSVGPKGCNRCTINGIKGSTQRIKC